MRDERNNRARSAATAALTLLPLTSKSAQHSVAVLHGEIVLLSAAGPPAAH